METQVGLEDIKKMIELLDAMTPKFHAPRDGLGKYLGDGIPRDWLPSLRTVTLANALRELISLRESSTQ